MLWSFHVSEFFGHYRPSLQFLGDALVASGSTIVCDGPQNFGSKILLPGTSTVPKSLPLFQTKNIVTDTCLLACLYLGAAMLSIVKQHWSKLVSSTRSLIKLPDHPSSHCLRRDEPCSGYAIIFRVNPNTTSTVCQISPQEVHTSKYSISGQIFIMIQSHRIRHKDRNQSGFHQSNSARWYIRWTSSIRWWFPMRFQNTLCFVLLSWERLWSDKNQWRISAQWSLMIIVIQTGYRNTTP